MRKQLSWVALIASLFLILISVSATYITLTGAIERETIRSGQVTYCEYFFSYLVGFEIPVISLSFFSGITLFILSVIWRRKVK